MATKRSPSPAAHMDDPSTSKQPRTEASAAPSESGPAVDPSAPTEAAPDAAPAAAVPPTGEEGAKVDEKQDEEEKTAEPPRRKGKKVDELETVAEWYRQEKLKGFPPDEALGYEYSEALNNKVHVWQGDITKLEVDCVVNAANKSLLGGGGVDGAIHSAAGRSLYNECKTLNGAETGETKLTGGHALPAKHIAHTVGPIWNNSRKGECQNKLRSCYSSTLRLCVENGLKTVAFSGISTGVYGYPLDEAAVVACDEVRKFLEGPDGDKIDAVLFVVFRQIDLNSYLDNLPEVFPPAPPSSQPAAAEEPDHRTATDAAQDKPTAAQVEAILAADKEKKD
ncbi:hypothetical protein JCM6882_000306 [Rhodosporidiobolus microsporus]